MTDEEKALVEALKRYTLTYNQRWKLVDLIETQARAIEQHEAYKREVSDAVEELAVCVYDDSSSIVRRYMGRFIIAKPDPLVEAIRDMALTDATQEDADRLRAALAARGGRIVWEGE